MYRTPAKVALLLVLFITIASVYFATRIQLDYDFQAFFPIGDPDLEFYEEYLESFESDNDYLLLGITKPEGIFEATFVQKLDRLTDSLEGLPYVQSITSPTTVSQVVLGPLGPIAAPYLHPQDPDRLATDSARIYQSPNLVGSFFSENGQSVAILIQHDEFLPKAQGDSLVSFIYEEVQEIGFENVHLAGKVRAQTVFIEKMRTELTLFISISFGMVVLFLALIYRSYYGVMLPLLVVGLGVIGIMGIMGFTGKNIDLMMVLLPTIMFVVGMSDVVHIMTKYIEELRFGASRGQALRTTFREVGLATFLTSFTTSVGFLTLYSSNIRPIKEFGLYTAIGVFVAFFMAFGVLPPLLLLLKPPKVAFHEKSKIWWNRFLRTLFIGVMRNRRAIAFGSILVLAISLVGLSRVQVNSPLLGDLRDDDPMKQDFNFFDDTFGGTRPFELAVQLQDSTRTPYDWQTLQTLERIHRFLGDSLEVGNLMSPLVVVKSINQAQKGGAPDQYKLPDSPDELRRMQRYLRQVEPGLYAPETRLLRVTGKMEDVGSKISSARTEALRQWLDAEVNDPGLAFTPTGTSVLIDNNNQYMVDNLIQGLAIAFAVISLIGGIMFKSVRMVIITLIPNIIPLLLAAGIMGYFGIALKLDTSMIFTIAFGIAVDDTIHFMSKLRLEVDKKKSRLYALKRTFLHTGKAIIITTLILSAGFLTLVFSSFGGTFYVGLLVGLTLIFALIVDLTLLPVLILWFFKIRKTSDFRRKKTQQPLTEATV